MAEPVTNLIQSTHEEKLAILVSQLADRVAAGESLDLNAVCLKYPQFEKDLRELWGVIVVTNMAAIEQSQATLPRVVAQPQSFQLPSQFGTYILEKEIGRGGMGIVFRANRLSDNQTVAIKMILKGEFATAAERSRFEAEAIAASRLNHPHIVPIYEIGKHEGHDFFCMKFLEGESLSERLSKSPLTDRKAAQILLQISQAIEHAHERGVLHRDLKPSNILLDKNGFAYVADFGLAKSFHDQNSLTRSGAVLGTPSYMAPEQASGAKTQIGPASDIYSLGAILYHCLTGRPPFLGGSAVETVMMVIEQDPVAPRVLNPKCDRTLELITMRCLQKPIDLRYPSAKELSSDLQAYLNNQPIAAGFGRFSQIVGSLLRETHHAVLLENWGLLWMWHSLVLLIASLLTQAFFVMDITNRWHYWLMWSVGLGAWAGVFWFIRRQMGPVTFVERQVAHVWGASMIGVMLVFPLEYLLDLPVLKLSPILGVFAGATFLIKGGMLSGFFYFPALIMFATSLIMGLFPNQAMAIFGVVSASCFFFSGLKYYRRKKRRLAK
jgi:eukaryotic-like serine/threonine-protein kinase